MPIATTVVVVAYHGDRWIPQCVESLLDSVRVPVRLVLVDNGGNTCIESLQLNGIDHMVLRTRQSLGFAEANNFALKKVGLDVQYVCFLNQDTRSANGWLDACLGVLEHAPKLGAISPLIYASDGRSWDLGFRDCARASPGLLARIDSGEDVDQWYKVPAVTAAAMVVRGDVLREVGPFDPIFGSYYEDYDLCRRLRSAGRSVGICTRARVDHFSGSATSGEEAERRRVRQILRNRTIHRFRQCGSKRLPILLRYLASDFPYNLCRSIVATPSAPPLKEFLAAHLDLLAIIGRLASEGRDQRAWQDYLKLTGWPDDTSGECRRPDRRAVGVSG